jgi:thioesterase domain-containing protein
MLIAKYQKDLEAVFPVAKSMGAMIISLSNDNCLIKLPLNKNNNHIGTAFGGSIYCAAVLSCYTWLKYILDQNLLSSKNLVIQSGNIDYKSPLRSDLIASCTVHESEISKIFLETLQKKQKSRIELTSNVLDDSGKVCAQFKGQYVLNLN